MAAADDTGPARRDPTHDAPCAVLFDLDGVLVDSTAIHEQVWAEFLEARRLPVPAGGIRSLFGRPGIEVLSEILGLPADSPEVGRVLTQLEERVEALVAERHPDGLLVDGAAALVLALAGRCRLAVVTSLRRHIATARLGDLREAFDVIVTADDVARGKPDPEAYLTAANRLGVAPTDCVVVEDAVAGVTAAKAAGATVVAVRSTAPEAALRDAGADTVIEHVTDLLEVLDGKDRDG